MQIGKYLKAGGAGQWEKEGGEKGEFSGSIFKKHPDHIFHIFRKL